MYVPMPSLRRGRWRDWISFVHFVLLREDGERWSGAGRAYIDGDEFEETVLGEDGDDDFVTCFRVVVKQGEAAGMGVYKNSGCVV